LSTNLLQALKIEAKLANVQNAADTHINACAVLSQLGRHQQALEHAQSALILLQEELLSPPGASATATPPKADRIAVLAIAYHNIGVENEFLKRLEQSLLSYRKGVEVAERYLGPKHAITITLKNSLIAAKKIAATSESKKAKEKGTASSAVASTLPTGKKPSKMTTTTKVTRSPGDKNVDSLADALTLDLGIDSIASGSVSKK
jgi:tetratricopeptide (TPR) repeat protein